jgi:hypothetical protein
MGWSSLPKCIGNIVYSIIQVDQHKQLILIEVASLPLATTNNCGEELCGLAIAAYIRVGLLRGTWVEEGASTLTA